MKYAILGVMFCVAALADVKPEPLKIWGNRLLATIDPGTGEVTLEKNVKQEEVTLALLRHIEAVATQQAQATKAKDAPKKETPAKAATK